MAFLFGGAADPWSPRSPVNDAELDGEIYEDAYLAPLNPDSEIYVIPKIGGG
jgi:hypothetical protein